MKIGMIGDLHIGARSGNAYMRDFIRSYILNRIIPEFKKRGITRVVQAGDFMDVRRSMYGMDRYWINYELIPAIEEAGMTWDVIVGNHDITYDDDDTVNWIDSLENMSDGLIRCHSEPEELPELNMLMVPWIASSNAEVCLEAIKNSTMKFCLGHFDISGFPMYTGCLKSEKGLNLEIFKHFDQVFSGHFHCRSSLSNIAYLGTPYHLNWQDQLDGTNRGFYTLDTETGECKFIKNDESCTIFREFEYDYRRIELEGLKENYLEPEYLAETVGLRGQIVHFIITNRENAHHYKKFLEAIAKVQMINYDSIDKTTTVRAEEVQVDERVIQRDTLEFLNTKIDTMTGVEKADLKAELESVYTVAINKKSVITK